MNSLIVAGFVLTLFLLSIMLGKKNQLVADRFLILYLGFVSFQQLYAYVEAIGVLQDSYWMLLGKGVYLLNAPFFFFYVYALIKQKHLKLNQLLILLSPFLAYVLHFFYYYFWIFDRVDLSIHQGLLFVNGELAISWLIFVALFLLIEPIILVVFYILLRDYRKRLLASVSNTERIHLNWLRILFVLSLISNVILVPIGTLTVSIGWLSTQFMETLIAVNSVIFLFVLGYFGFKQTTVFSDLELDEPSSRKTSTYERSGLSSLQAKEYHAQLLKLMEEQKPYLNGELTAGALAQLLGISVNHLSQVLNKEQQQNFFDFVNSYRVNEVIEKMKNPSFAHLTLLAIALDGGFNSKTSFNTIFKKITHQTPSHYYKSLAK